MKPMIRLAEDISVLSCPFCGDNRIRYYGGANHHRKNGYNVYADIVCSGCGAKIRREVLFDTINIESAMYVL